MSGFVVPTLNTVNVDPRNVTITQCVLFRSDRVGLDPDKLATIIVASKEEFPAKYHIIKTASLSGDKLAQTLKCLPTWSVNTGSGKVSNSVTASWINKITISKTNRFINQITLSTSICISIHPFRDPDTLVRAIAINLPISGYEPKDSL